MKCMPLASAPAAARGILLALRASAARSNLLVSQATRCEQAPCTTICWFPKPTAAQGLFPGPQSKPSGSATRFAGGSTQSQCRAFLLAPCPATAQGIDACAVAQPRCNDLRWRLKPTTIQTTSLAPQCSRSARRCCAYLTPVAAQCNEFMLLLSEFCCFFQKRTRQAPLVWSIAQALHHRICKAGKWFVM